MTLYALQKAIRQVNLNSTTRAQFMDAPETVVEAYPLSNEERAAMIARDYGALYRMGVHGLLLRPFSILHKVPEPDYLAAIRADAP